MEDIKKFETFVNESIFFSKYKDIVEILYNYIKKSDVGIFSHRVDGGGNDRYGFVLKKAHKEEDPLGEEVWEGEDVQVELKKEYHFMSVSYDLYIDKDEVNASHYEIKKLFNAVKKRYKNREQEERDLRIRGAIKKFEEI